MIVSFGEFGGLRIAAKYVQGGLAKTKNRQRKKLDGGRIIARESAVFRLLLVGV
jgi:hypothetical protein